MSNSSEIVSFDYKNPINAFAAFSMFVIGDFGVICNALMVYIFCKEKSERTSFNLICLFRAVANIYILISAFFADFIPATLIGYSVYEPYTELVIIAITNSIYVVNMYITIIVAANRFFALFLPILYNKLFGFKTTFFYLIAIYAFRGFMFMQQLIENPEGCYYLFDVGALAWGPTEECSHLQDFFMVFVLCSLVVISVMNFATFMKVIMFYKNGPSNRDQISRQKIRGNIRLFFQTVLQDSLFLLDLTSTYKLNGLYSNRIWTFICGSQIWQCLHSFDGFVMIMFNGRFSIIKQRLWTSSTDSKNTNGTRTLTSVQ